MFLQITAILINDTSKCEFVYVIQNFFMNCTTCTKHTDNEKRWFAVFSFVRDSFLISYKLQAGISLILREQTK